jgi:aldehyde dehydrogenase (NAD+)
MPTDHQQTSTARRPPDAVAAAVERLRKMFGSGVTRSYDWRREQLQQLRRMLVEQEAAIQQALADDLGKSGFEAYATEIAPALAETDLALRSLKRWMKPQRVSTPLICWPGRSRIEHQPLGVVLIIAPWNYPFHLSVLPLIGALAAGNCVLLKPSTTASRTCETLAGCLGRYLDPDAVCVMPGDAELGAQLLEHRFDHIFFTGSERVGRQVMAAAAEHLTSVTLELGGKSPCVVLDDAALSTTARQIVWGKCLNAGQTCVAPDYVLVDAQIADKLTAHLQAAVIDFFGNDPQQSPDYPRIISDQHFDRLSSLLSEGTIAFGGTTDRADRYIAPTIMTNVPLSSPLMRDEIFGPILPVIPISTAAEALTIINTRPRPLALYLFSANDQAQREFLEKTSSGGVCINDVMLHLSVPGLPFGGVGASGMGAYHGYRTFQTFSHARGVLKKRTRLDVPLRYPPYTQSKLQWVRRLT